MKNRGFSLIEIIVAVVIMSIAFYALITVFTIVVPRDINARTLTLGTHLANQKMEETTLKSFTAVASTSATAFPPPFENYYNQVIVNYVTTAELDTVSASATNYKRIKVRVWGPQLNILEAVTIVTTYEVKKT